MNYEKFLSNPAYQKLRSKNLESWSEEELSRFLVLDYFDIFSTESVSAKDLKEKVLKSREFSILKYDKYKTPFSFVDRFFLKLYLKNIKKNPSKKILFQSSKYSSLILESKKHYNTGLIVQGRKDRFFALKNFMGYLGANDLDQFVFNYLKEGNIKYLYQLLGKVEEKLMMVNPDYIVLLEDNLQIGRAIVLVSKKMGITTLVVQPGTGDSSFYIYEDFVADYFLAWGQYSKILQWQSGIRKLEDIYILGYPYLVKTNEALIKNNHRTVCYLGQDYERYIKDLLEVKLQILNKLSETCKKLGLKFIYRCHPGDDRRALLQKLPNIFFVPKKEKIEETFERADIFISFSSTALVEAAMRQKITLQLMDFPIKLDNLEKLGACSKSFENLAGLENCLTKIANAQNLNEFKIKFNNDYIETRYNPGQRFLEIIKEIENNKKLKA